MDRPIIAVLGAGAVGSLIGGLLARAGQDVTLIGRPAHMQAIAAHGLRIEGILGDLVIPVKVAEHLEFHPQLVLLAVKTQDVEASLQPILSLLKESGILTLQNGVRSDQMVASMLPKENVLGGVVMLNAQFLQPGQITYARRGSLLIGEAFGENGVRVKEVKALLDQAVKTKISNDIQAAHWTKLLVNNLGNGLEAMTGLPIRECMQYAGLRRIGVLALKEGYRVIESAGYRLAPLPGAPLTLLRFVIQSPVTLAAGVLNLSIGSLKTLSSTLQSQRRGRPTEIDYLNGEIVRVGTQVHVPTPYNTRVVELVKEVEKSGQFRSIDEVIRCFPSH